MLSLLLLLNIIKYSMDRNSTNERKGYIKLVLMTFVELTWTIRLVCWFQVFGRNLILFGLILQEPKLQEREVIWWLFLTWSAVEVIRWTLNICFITRLPGICHYKYCGLVFVTMGYLSIWRCGTWNFTSPRDWAFFGGFSYTLK